MRLLIKAGADVLLRRRSSLLHFVKKPELAKPIIEAGLDVNCLDEKGRTPLDVAEESRQLYQRQAVEHGDTGWETRAREYAELVAFLRAHGAQASKELKP